MSAETKGKITVWIDLAYKAAWPVAVLLIYLLKSEFVTQRDFKNLTDRQTQTETTLKLMAEQNRVNDRQDSTLLDHEQRIRALERRN